MGTLYLDRKQAELRHSGQTLLLYAEGTLLQRIPVRLLERVVIYGQMTLNSATLGLLAEAGVGVSLISGRQGKRLAQVSGGPQNDARRRLAQYRASCDVAEKENIARCVLQRKLQAQQRFLQQARQKRPDLRHVLHKAIGQIMPLRQRLQQEDLNLPAMRGIEGAAAAAYFRAYTELFPASLDFTGRRRRPPPDPVNACLSLAYTIAHGNAVQAVHAAGLDPYLGFLHEIDYGRESLAADLIEPLRPRIDRWVWGLFRDRVLRADHFTREQGGCLLGKEGRKYFYMHHEMFARVYRRWQRRFVYGLVHHLMDSDR